MGTMKPLSPLQKLLDLDFDLKIPFSMNSDVEEKQIALAQCTGINREGVLIQQSGSARYHDAGMAIRVVNQPAAIKSP